MKIRSRYYSVLTIIALTFSFAPFASKAEAQNSQGKIIATLGIDDSRFDPKANGFSFINYGNGTFTANNGPINGIGNDTASSVIVPANFMVRLCSEEGRDREGGGNCEEYGEGKHNLKYGRQASWIKVWIP